MRRFIVVDLDNRLRIRDSKPVDRAKLRRTELCVGWFEGDNRVGALL